MPRSILLADDSATIQQAVSMTFAAEDVSVTTVGSGQEAIARARQEKPDLILADVTMPGLGGYELCEKLRGDASLRHIPVLLLGGGTPVDPAKAIAVGANGHLPKPFDSQKLIDQVKQILANPNQTPGKTAPVPSSSRPPTPAARPPPLPPGAVARPPAPGSAVRPPAGSMGRPTGAPPAARPPVPPAAAARPATPPAARPPPPSAPLGRPPVAPGRPVAPPPAARPPAPAAKASVPSPDRNTPASRPPGIPPRRPPAAPGLGVDETDAPAKSLRPLPAGKAAPSLSVVPGHAASSDGGEAELRAALSKASREVIERIAWEVVPELAETIIREELERLMKERGA